jgi:superoxide dismutase, Cu-Zn family
MRNVLAIIALSLTFGCVPDTASTPKNGTKLPQSIFARLQTIENGTLVVAGQAQLVETQGGMKLYLNLEKRPTGLAGEVGMHIHGIGKCELPDFASAGPHWNPEGKQHGLKNSQGHHAGDITNINILLGPQTTNALKEIPGATIVAILDADGAAIVIHEKADDYLTDPSGNSGKRVICGVFERP